MFKEADISDYFSIKEFCWAHEYESVEIVNYIIKKELNYIINNDSRIHFSHEEGEIDAVFYYSSSGILTICCDDNKVFDSIDFLYLLKDKKPVWIRASCECAKYIKNKFFRVFKSSEQINYYTMNLQELSDDNATRNFKNTYSETMLEKRRSIGFKIVDAQYINWIDNINFLIEVDRYFNNRYISVNYKKKNIEDSLEQDVYMVCADRNNIPIAQIVAGKSTDKYCVISGLYVKNAYRGLKLSSDLIVKMVEFLDELSLIPILYVEETNRIAIDVYKNHGFQIIDRRCILNVEY